MTGAPAIRATVRNGDRLIERLGDSLEKYARNIDAALRQPPGDGLSELRRQMGVGLWLTDALAMQDGGGLWFTRRPGGGVRAVVSLSRGSPRRVPHAREVEVAAPKTKARGAGARILK